MFMPGGPRTMRTIRAPRALLNGGTVVRLSPAVGQKPACPCSGNVPRRAIAAQAAEETFADATAKPAFVDGQINEFPAQSGVYAVYDSEDTLQFIGVSRNISMTIQNHSKVVGDAVHSIKASVVENPTKDELLEAWKAWLQDAADATGSIPPGNAAEKELWQPRRQPAAKPELKLTPGKGMEDLTCPVGDLIDLVVKSEKVVAFIKGTRTQPQCGFSYQMLTTLNGLNTDFQVVNVLDEVYNPGLREAIKEYSAWPTIPQLYVDGEFVGGADIVQEMAGNGELAKVLNGSS